MNIFEQIELQAQLRPEAPAGTSRCSAPKTS
jgi:hypothetical protein